MHGKMASMELGAQQSCNGMLSCQRNKFNKLIMNRFKFLHMTFNNINKDQSLKSPAPVHSQNNHYTEI